MKKWLIVLACASLIFAAIGCQKAEEPAAAEDKTTSATDTSTNNASTAEMMKCEGCGSMHDKADMVDVDGKMMCKDCADKLKSGEGSGGS
ncbi:MAG: hypothetical protein AKCLJLPJ_01152 [Fimbriimonadales bacterium]|nr:MAG: hypothetical protein EDM73_11625 [Armatimonadota bacterium]MBV6503089.1 hypothetical protein [Fimbriimonadales bacterium]MCE7900860.1 hypothetical protein [Armatimonadetes bacterium ATM1]MDL1929710.1 hypothetical protein [Fimbriimonadia bacterium ATM]MBC6970549.1 hypothetical protein [Armatimonadota bacterium]